MHTCISCGLNTKLDGCMFFYRERHITRVQVEGVRGAGARGQHTALLGAAGVDLQALGALTVAPRPLLRARGRTPTLTGRCPLSPHRHALLPPRTLAVAKYAPHHADFNLTTHLHMYFISPACKCFVAMIGRCGSIASSPNALARTPVLYTQLYLHQAPGDSHPIPTLPPTHALGPCGRRRSDNGRIIPHTFLGSEPSGGKGACFNRQSPPSPPALPAGGSCSVRGEWCLLALPVSAPPPEHPVACHRPGRR